MALFRIHQKMVRLLGFGPSRTRTREASPHEASTTVTEPCEEEPAASYAQLPSTMSETDTILFTRKEKTPESTHVFETEDGTIFYYDNDGLYVKWRGERVNADLPDVYLSHFVARGNTLYFTTVPKAFNEEDEREEVIKAVFSDGRIDISHVRTQQEGELLCRGISTIEKNGNKFVCNIFEEPDRDGILIDLDESELKDLHLYAIHRGRAIYLKDATSKRPQPFIHKWSDNWIVIHEASADCWYATLSCTDSSPFVYLNIDLSIAVLDTRTMKFLPHLELEGIIVVYYIISVRDGIIAVCTATKPTDTKPYQRYLATASLPIGYFEGTALEEFDSELVKFLRNFEPRGILGKGAFGCVFEARNLTDDWIYAVKRLAFSGRDCNEEVMNALKEVRTHASLRHEGIVSYNGSWIERPPEGWQNRTDDEFLKKFEQKETLNYDDDSVFIYIQMEMCMHSLQQWLESNTTRELNQAKFWFKQLVAAVGYLHQKDMIHRDLKPGNILFDNDGRIKICDLGLVAEFGEQDVTRTWCGTPMYMAPEQRFRYNSKVDIFSLGLILAELCVLMTFQEAKKAFLLYQDGKPTTILKGLPEVDRFVTWLTNIDAEKRPTCEQILAHQFLVDV